MAALLHSYTYGASTIPLLSDKIGARFDQVAASWPDREAIVVGDWFTG
jgi:hypothetical protein